MGMVFNDFGTLAKVEMNSDYIIITNSRGEQRKMSRGRYKESADAVYEKAQDMIGKEVSIQTSQNTGPWDSDTWFSDIFLK